MSEIAQKLLVHAPLASAERLLHGFVAAHPGPADGARVTMHARDLEVPAIVSLRPERHPGEMTPSFHVHWEAEDGGLYPVFDGRLRVGADEDYDAFRLLLAGRYTPPLGLAGKVFDVVVGHAIAVRTAKALLDDMRTWIEAHVAEEEAKKPHPAR